MRWLVTLVLVAPLAGCGPSLGEVEEGSPSADRKQPTAETPSSELRVVMLGDSLTAGYGLSSDEAFPALAQAELQRLGWSVEVVNAGVSGDTTAGGRARLDWLLKQRPDVVVVALGANDGLRGLPIDELAENLRRIVVSCLDEGALVLLAGMRVPPNYGPDYAAAFGAVYPALADELQVTLMPFLLEDVGGRADLNQADGIHPNAAGHRIIAAAIVPYLEDLLRRVRGEEAA